MVTKEKIESWYTPSKMQIEYDGKYCFALCEKKEVCEHREGHAKTLKDIFDKVPYESRERIIDWLSKNDFEDTVRELYETHCSDCWGTGEGSDKLYCGEDTGYNWITDGTLPCHCQVEARLADAADAAWAERE